MDATFMMGGTGMAGATIEIGEVGAIVRGLRRARNLTLAELAARCGYSVSTLSRMERGKQPLRDVTVLRNLAEALNIPPQVFLLADTRRRSQLAPDLVRVNNIVAAPDEEANSMRRRTLLAGLTSVTGTAVAGGPLPGAAASADPVSVLEDVLLTPSAISGMPMTMPQLRRDVATAHSVFQAGRYIEVATRLPTLLSSAMATRAEMVSGDEIAEVSSQFAEIYLLASELMVKFGRDHLAWTTADRALQAADVSGDILTQAGARRAWAIVLRRSGRAEMAQRVITDAAAALQPDLGNGPEYLSVYGSLLSTAAYTAATDGDRDTARTLITEASDAATRLGMDGNYRFRAFGPTSVELYQIGIARVLGDPGTAIEAARRINPATMPQAERRARYWTDVARSYHQWGKPEPCYRALLAAERAAPDEVHRRPRIQQIIASLVQHPSARNLPGLRAFATRAGVRL
jgi:transcriptional regulator with XRE-family HTH domain